MDGKMLFQLIMREIGIDIDANGYIVDQDVVGFKLGLNGKLFRFNKTNRYMRLPSDETLFNPLSNIHVMKSLYEYYLAKLEQTGEKSFAVSSLDTNDHILFVRDYEGKAIKSNIYMNMILCYCDLILRIGGSFEQADALICLDNKEFKIE